MRIINLMPAMRWELWGQIKDNLAIAHEEGVDLRWWPAVFTDETRPDKSEWWIDPVIMLREPGEHPITRKNNFSLNLVSYFDVDFYIFFGSDDNLIPRKLWGQWRAAAESDPDVIVISCKRGQRSSQTPHGTSDLIAAPENMKCEKVTGEQLLIHSRVMQGRQLAQGPLQDGILAEQLVSDGLNIKYLPDVWIPFNALEPGRWDADRLREVME